MWPREAESSARGQATTWTCYGERANRTKIVHCRAPNLCLQHHASRGKHAKSIQPSHGNNLEPVRPGDWLRATEQANQLAERNNIKFTARSHRRAAQKGAHVRRSLCENGRALTARHTPRRRRPPRFRSNPSRNSLHPTGPARECGARRICPMARMRFRY